MYYGVARLGLRYASIGESVSLVWPPTGLALAALTVFGLRYWPGVAIGAFLANSATDVPVFAAFTIAVGNTLEALAAAYLLKRGAGPRPRLDSARTVRTLVLVAAPFGALISAIVGAGTLFAIGTIPQSGILSTTAVWWTGDLLGALVVAPILLAWGSPEARRIPRGILEITLLCLGTVAVAELALGPSFSLPLLGQVEYPYLLFPFVIWAALRFGAAWRLAHHPHGRDRRRVAYDARRRSLHLPTHHGNPVLPRRATSAPWPSRVSRSRPPSPASERSPRPTLRAA